MTFIGRRRKGAATQLADMGVASHPGPFASRGPAGLVTHGSLRLEAVEGRNPRDIKFELALEIVTRFHSAPAAKIAHESFMQQFSARGLPEDIPEIQVMSPTATLALATALKSAGLASSTSEARRALAQRAVRVDELRIEDEDARIEAGKRYLIQVGKRKFAFIEVRLENS